MMRKWLMTMATGLCVLVLGISIAQADIKGKKIRLAYAGWGIGTAVAYVGVDSGLFKKYDVDVEEVFIQDALTGGVQSLMGVDFVLGFGDPLAIFQPILKGADIVFVGSHVTMEQYGMGVSSDVSGVRDLRGKKVGVSALGGRSDLVARVILRRAGLDPLSDVEILAAGISPQRVLALSQGIIQGAPLRSDAASQAKKLGIRILEVKEVPVISALLMTTRSFIKRDEEAARRFIKAYVAAIHYYLTHRAESIAIMRKYINVAEPGALEAMYEAFAAQLGPVPTPNGEAVQALVDAISVADKRAKTLKPQELFDLHFLEELKSNGFINDLYSEKTSL